MMTLSLDREIASPGPVRPNERVELIDALRGFALFGVLLVNWDNVRSSIRGVVEFVAEGSFYPEFSLLFGLGFAIQLMRADAQRRRFVLRYLWRSGILLGLGILHFIFLFDQEILRIYALSSIVLIITTRWKPGLLLSAALCLLLFHAMPQALLPPPGEFWVLADLERQQPREMQQLAEIAHRRTHPPVVCQALPGLTPEYRRFVCNNATSVRQLLSISVTTPQLASTSVTSLSFWKRWADVMAMFLLGAYIGRKRILADPSQHTRLFVLVVVFGFGFGAVGNAVEIYGVWPALASPGGWDFAGTVGGVGFGLCYLAGFAWLWVKAPRMRRVLAPLRYVGRMALTNYLFQSVVFGLVLGRLLGVSATLTDWWNLLILAGFFAIQVAYSSWWFRHFQYGPVEWVWRSLVWGRPHPFRPAPKEVLSNVSA